MLFKVLLIEIHRVINVNTKYVDLWQIFRNRHSENNITYEVFKRGCIHRDSIETIPNANGSGHKSEKIYDTLQMVTTDLINMIRHENNKVVRITIYINEKNNKKYTMIPGNKKSVKISANIISYIEKYFASSIKNPAKKKGKVEILQ